MSIFDSFVSAYGPLAKVDAFGYLVSIALGITPHDLPQTTPHDVPKHGKVLLITAATPLKASRGEGKTTATVALTDALRVRGIDAAAVLRQPSMGITAAGSKGGASGGGKSSLQHSQLTDWGLFGEMARIATAQNLIVSLAEKALEEGVLDTIVLPRVSEIPSKALRSIAVAKGSLPETCVLTPASEMMQVVTLSRSLKELHVRIGALLVGSLNGVPVQAKDLIDVERIVTVLGDAVQPVILQTEQGSPVYMHCGPFGNVSLGIPSLVSIDLACSRHDVVLVEAGYGADMGGEKYLDIAAGVAAAPWPAAAVVVTRASTWRDDPTLQWRYPFHINRLEDLGIASFPLLNLWDGEDGQVDSLRQQAEQQGFREPIAGNLFRDGGAALADQLDGLISVLSGSCPVHLYDKSLEHGGVGDVRSRLADIILNTYGVPAERIIERETFAPTLAVAAAQAQAVGLDIDHLAICPVKSPGTMTDDDSLPESERTVTLKKVTLHAGARLLMVNLTSSLTTTMPKIV